MIDKKNMSKTNLQYALNNLLEFQQRNRLSIIFGQEFFKAAIKQIHGEIDSYGLPPAPAWKVIERDGVPKVSGRYQVTRKRRRRGNVHDILFFDAHLREFQDMDCYEMDETADDVIAWMELPAPYQPNDGE